MNTFWRIALAWMLALALPLQGHAAQRLLSCAASPAPVVAEGLAVPQPAAAMLGPQHAQHDPAAHAVHGAHEGDAHPEPAAAAGDASTHSAGHSPQADSCSACASCCNAAALPPSILQLNSVQPAQAETPFVQRVLQRVWPDGLERPPRSPQR